MFCFVADYGATVIQLGDVAAADIPDLPELLDQLGYPSDADAIAARVQRIGDAGGRVLVAREDDEVLGVMALEFLALLHHDDDLCRITALVVADRARGRGVGRRLVAEAERIARAHRCGRIEVTSAEHRAAAHAFYLALGYHEQRKRFLKHLE